MGQLNNLYVSSSYQGLLKMTDSSNGLTNSLQTIQTGDGDNSPLQMSLTEVNISGSFFINNVPITNGTNGTSGTSGSSGSDGTDGTSGTSGTDGSSGTSGSSGTDGSSGTSGTDGSTGSSGSDGSSGTSGSSGTDGSSGTSGTDGSTGSSGSDGSSGTSGSSGTDGSSGTSGSDGSSGSSGTDGSSGSSGSNGSDGSSGTSGSNGTNGSSGSSGTSGSNGTNGSSGSDGTSGSNGTDGTSGTSGSNGTDGTSGTSGSNGTDGSSGTSGTSGSNGSDGTSGSNGSSGTSGTSGSNGSDGSSGTSGSNGTDGISGSSGTSGSNGSSGSSGTSGSNGTDGSSGSNGTDGSSGTSGDSLFALTGSIWNTTNDLGITGSLNVKNSIIMSDEYNNTVISYTDANDRLSIGNASLYVVNNIKTPVINDLGYGDFYIDVTYLKLRGNNGINLDPSNGSVVVTGSLRVNGDTILSGSLIGNTVNGGLIKIQSEANRSGSVQYNITGSSPISQSNIIMGGTGPTAANITGSIVISGSNNILLNAARTSTVNQGTYGYIGGNGNIGNVIPTLGTGSVISPTTSNNQLQSALFLQFTTSSVLAVPTINSNVLYGLTRIDHQSGSITFNNNFIGGNGVTSTANTTTLGLIPTISSNIFGGTQFPTITLNHNSSSITYQGNIGGGMTVTNNYTSSVSTAVNNITVQGNLLNGQSNTLVVTGSNSGTRRVFDSNTILGRSNIINSNHSGSVFTGGHLVSTAILGQNLIVSASHTTTTVGGTVIVGRFNATGSLQESSQDTVFVVGTGTADGSRRNALRIDSDNNSNFTGSVNITGSLTLNGVAFSSGTSGTSGTDGTSGSNGSDGTSGTNGSSGTSGDSLFALTGSIWNTTNNVGITGSLNISGSNTFIGNTTITGSLLLSGSAPFDLIVTGSGRFVSQDALAQLTMSPTSFNVNSTKTVATGAEGFIFGSTGSNAQFYLGVYDEPNFTTDVELNIKTDSNGILFNDWDNGNTFSYVPFMTLAPNTGNNPTPQFTRGLGITGSLRVSGDVMFASGSNKTMGTVALDGANPGTVTVSNSLVTTSSLIFLTKQTNNHPNAGPVVVSSKGTGTFTITSNHNGDADTVAYQIINPA